MLLSVVKHAIRPHQCHICQKCASALVVFPLCIIPHLSQANGVFNGLGVILGYRLGDDLVEEAVGVKGLHFFYYFKEDVVE